MSLKNTIEAVADFHDAFGIENNHQPTVKLTKKEIDLRFRLMQEENQEYLEAANKGDLVEVADALGDMLYILCGTILKHGMQHKIMDVFEEIQRSNMSKLDKDGQPIYREDGKVLKSELYFKPDIKSILEA
jgi:predicted HAD superfamily Cof-like phosphohydrolase